MTHTDVLSQLIEIENNHSSPEVTGKDMIWLRSRGDRDSEDVLIDEKGRKFVLMYTPETYDKVDVEGNERVYLPIKYGPIIQYTPASKMNQKGELYSPLNWG